MKSSISSRTWVLSAVLALATAWQCAAAESAGKQYQYIDILKSSAPPADKAMACKRLAVYGDQEAVPALAPLLTNAELSSWARISLEVIPGPAADEALRDALTKVQGRLLIGVINSIGVRRDAKAVTGLSAALKNSDAGVAGAAGEALGRIGTDAAAQVLEAALTSTEGGVLSSVAYGSVVCAEQLLAAGKRAEAIHLFDQVRKSNTSRQRKAEATRGAILARGAEGLPLLLEQLRSKDKTMFGIGMLVARELPGAEVTAALVQELEKTSPERQAALFRAVADRTDASVLPKLLQVAQSGSKELRGIAISMLDRFQDAAPVPVLLDASVDEDAAFARNAKAVLARLSGQGVEQAILDRIPQVNGKKRQVLLEVARQRRIEGTLPAAIAHAKDTDAGVRRAAVETIGAMGAEKEALFLVIQLPAATENDVETIERALVSICGRTGAKSLPHVMPLVKSKETSHRQIALRSLAVIGGSQALASVKEALQDKSEAVQDEAVATLANWSNNFPDDTGVAEPLLTLAKSGRKPAHQLQGIRGYLQYLQDEKKMNASEKLNRVKDVLPLIKAADEKRLAIAVLGSAPSQGSLEFLNTLVNDESVTEEACLAVVKVAADAKAGIAPEVRKQALQSAAGKAKNQATLKQAQDALKKL